MLLRAPPPWLSSRGGLRPRVLRRSSRHFHPSRLVRFESDSRAHKARREGSQPSGLEALELERPRSPLFGDYPSLCAARALNLCPMEGFTGPFRPISGRNGGTTKPAVGNGRARPSRSCPNAPPEVATLLPYRKAHPASSPSFSPISGAGFRALLSPRVRGSSRDCAGTGGGGCALGLVRRFPRWAHRTATGTALAAALPLAPARPSSSRRTGHGASSAFGAGPKADVGPRWTCLVGEER